MSLTRLVILAITFCSALSAAPCEDLAKLSLPQTTVTMAVSVPPGAFQPPAGFSLRQGPSDVKYADMPAFCRFAATMRPSGDSEIKIEVWLPTAAVWNGKFMAIGNGGQAGEIYYQQMGLPLSRGYAVASTDTGHVGTSTDGSYALGHPEKVIDFGYRAVHEMVEKSRAVVASYYTRAPKYSYWRGCSTGGRQGLEDIQRYPNDFDGAITGAPALNPLMAAQVVWVAQAVHKDAGSLIPPAKFDVLHRAVLDQCDASDGVKDGVLENPTKCKFDPKVVQCKGGDGPDCLTEAQVDAARKIYSAPTNPRTGTPIAPGFMPGSEKGWGFAASAEPPKLTLTGLQNSVFKDLKWDYRTFNFDSDVAVLERESAARDARNPNLQPFFAHGGKLLQYHGWSDNLIAPLNTINYYNTVADTLGGVAKIDGSYRVFTVPGMAHCQGGDGTDRFDTITALEQWVEKGKAPDSIPAARYAGDKVVRTRPLCPYPQVAVYKGSGSTDQAENFSCRVQ